MVSNVTCFCDIALKDCAIHIEKYGQFGLSFDRAFLIMYATRPVMYIPYDPTDHLSIYGKTLVRDILAVYESYDKIVAQKLETDESGRQLGHRTDDEQIAKSAIASIYGKDFMAFVKAFDSTLPENHPDNYYMEREWRRLGNVVFKPTEVRRIVVAPSYVDHAKRDWPEYKEKICACPL